MIQFKDLIPLSDYLEQNEKLYSLDFYNKIVGYKDFLKQPLKLSQFIPCDENQNPLEKPKKPLSPATDQQWDKWTNAYVSYQKALERVIFEGFEAVLRKHPLDSDYYYEVIKDDNIIWVSWNKSKTIEDLTHLNIKSKY